MNALKAKDNIWWVGSLDKDLRIFDIIMYTDYGTTYNAYIVKGTEKTVLFETVKEKFFADHLAKVKEVCDPADIDYIVFDHTEPDHSGSLAQMIKLAPKATVLGSMAAINFLKEIVNEPFPHRVVTEKDVIDIGGASLHFFMTPMLHWPDTMFTWIPEYRSLFTCDVFGCHYADDAVFNDKIEGDFVGAYKYYFDNIMGPYKNPHMANALKKIEGLPIEFIGNGHGPVLRTDIDHYLKMYHEWTVPTVNDPKKVVIPYVTSYGYTRQLAEKIAEGVRSEGLVAELYDLVYGEKDKAIAALETADGILLGTPTMVGDALPPAYEMLMHLNPIIHKGKFGGAFGSFGWSGEAVANLTARMQQLKMNVPMPAGYRVRLKPSEEQLAGAVQFGVDFAKAVKA